MGHATCTELIWEMPTTGKTVAIVLGSLLVALGVNVFLAPFEVLDGGVIGLALILKYLWDVKAGFTMIVLSVPIFILAWFRYRSYFYNSLHGMLASSFLIDLLHPLQHQFHYELGPLVSALIGGTMVGTGIGLMLRYNTSTGGTDLLSQFFADTFSINVGWLILLLDGFIVLLGGLLISWETFFLSIATILSGGIATGLCNLKKPHVDAV
jgi:uncharacterized membrane-anchored protein YitT (DUF2179 family)